MSKISRQIWEINQIKNNPILAILLTVLGFLPKSWLVFIAKIVWIICLLLGGFIWLAASFILISYNPYTSIAFVIFLVSIWKNSYHLMGLSAVTCIGILVITASPVEHTNNQSRNDDQKVFPSYIKGVDSVKVKISHSTRIKTYHPKKETFQVGLSGYGQTDINMDSSVNGKFFFEKGYVYFPEYTKTDTTEIGSQGLYVECEWYGHGFSGKSVHGQLMHDNNIKDWLSEESKIRLVRKRKLTKAELKEKELNKTI
ncbi:hypothetical protein [Flammeovirga sp. SubArs3]|uniref:hypothetical protein n=1 Tax=Flammeovirga sp. SubArs3 TaxID=2995316 RepID=UPI00248B8A35|nr:hypothetical protein [Flammeovirga sp. SubArs3]